MKSKILPIILTLTLGTFSLAQSFTIPEAQINRFEKIGKPLKIDPTNSFSSFTITVQSITRPNIYYRNDKGYWEPLEFAGEMGKFQASVNSTKELSQLELIGTAGATKLIVDIN